MALKDGIDWLLHVDTDELIYPSGSPAYSLQVHSFESGGATCAFCSCSTLQCARFNGGVSRWACMQEVLGQVPADVDTLVFPNYESLPERDDVVDPFLEVTMFKKNYAHVVSGAVAC